MFTAKPVILIRSNFEIARANALSKSTDGPTGWPAENPPNWYGLEDFQHAIPTLLVRAHCHPGYQIGEQFSFDPKMVLYRQFGTIWNTMEHRCLANRYPTTPQWLISTYIQKASICTACIHAKHKQKLIKVSSRHTTMLFEPQHSDCCGPF